ncbi:hypothetical protein D8829_05890 [Streptococcus intermedius]|nr:hypothetical protein D8829_05890 [Streptococcus intermedius]
MLSHILRLHLVTKGVYLMKNNNLLKISQDLGNDFDLPYYIYIY